MTAESVVLDWLAAADPLLVVSRPLRSMERLGYRPDSAYVEMYWLPILGPSAVLAARRLNAWAAPHADGFAVSLEELGQCLGVGTGIGRRSPIVRSLARLIHFGLARIDSDGYALRREFPMLSARLLERLPACLIHAHELLIQGSTRGVIQTLPPAWIDDPAASSTGM